MRKTFQLTIEGMTCNGCAERIREELKKEAGIIGAEVSLKQGTALVQFNRELTTVDKILNSDVFNKTYRVKGSKGRTFIHNYKAELLGE